MKKMLCALLALTLALCPLLTLADGLTAELIGDGEQKTVLFTDEDGDTYLLIIDEDGVSATLVSSASEEKAAAVSDPCWRCGKSLSVGDHTAGSCGFKYHSACMDDSFCDPDGHKLCPICGSCMYSSGSSHGIGFGMCGAALMQEKTTCSACGLKYSEYKLHGNSKAADSSCTVHCWISSAPHAACPLCGRALCNGEKHAAGVCNK